MASELDRFSAWVQAAVDLSVACLDVASSEVMVLLGNQSGVQHTFQVGDTDTNASSEGRLDVGREIIAESNDDEFYSLVWCGEAPGKDGRNVDVIAVESGDRAGHSVLVMQPYRVKKTGTLSKVGELLISQDDSGNIWNSDLVDPESLESSDEVTTADPSDADESDEANPLNDLVISLCKLALDRLKSGEETPFACLAFPDEEEVSLIMYPSEDEGFDELIEKLRETVATRDKAHMYGIVYLGTSEADGKEVEMVFVEAGQRGGEAPVFGLPFKITKKSGLKTQEIEFLNEIKNLWANE